MKPLYTTALTILSLIFLSSSCKKHEVQPVVSELSKLPPATQTGANTFGCLVNGQAFLPGGSVFAGAHLQCNYIYTGGGFYFTVAANDKENNVIKDIFIGTDSLTIAQGKTYKFSVSAPENPSAFYALIDGFGNVNKYVTSDTTSGQLTITKLDSVKQIVSGTFYFNAINTGKDVVKITDGRFDMLYTR